MTIEKIEWEGIGTVTTTTEFLQDVEIQMRLLGKFRTTEITEEEIADWKEVYFGPPKTEPEDFDKSEQCISWREMLGCNGPGFKCPILTDAITEQEISEWGEEYDKLKKIDIDEVRKKYNVKFESDEEPPYPIYQEDGSKKYRRPGSTECDINWLYPWADGDVNSFANRDTYGPDRPYRIRTTCGVTS